MIYSGNRSHFWQLLYEIISIFHNFFFFTYELKQTNYLNQTNIFNLNVFILFYFICAVFLFLICGVCKYKTVLAYVPIVLSLEQLQ